MEITEDVAYAEVYAIINHMQKNDLAKLPNEVFILIDRKRNPNYKVDLDLNKDIKSQNISYEAKKILSAIYCKYWISQKNKEKIDNSMKKYRFEKENELRKKYDVNVFSNIRNTKTDDKMPEEETSLAEINTHQSIFSRIINIFRNLFDRRD